MHKNQLLERLNSHTAKVGIIGLGYVGLPLAVACAEVGIEVIGVDLDPRTVEAINKAVSYIPDIPTEQVAPLAKSGKLRAANNYEALKDVDAVSICVPTPLLKTKDPDMSYVTSSLDALAPLVHPGMLIVLESTTYPGTTNELVIPKLVDGRFKVGEEVFIAFSPERIDPGNPKYGVKNTPKVIGGVTEACQEVGCAYYGQIIDQVIPVGSPTVAELVKLLENTFRAVNIGLVNELALMCDKLGVDVWEVIRAATTKPFGFMPFYPGPGLGGHCIPIDPLYLSWKMKSLNYTARFIDLASEINTSMPVYVVNKIAHALNDESKAVRGSKIAVLGVAYKKDIDDVRESPALDVIQLLEERGAVVSYHDPYVPSVRLEHGRKMDSTPLTSEWLREADCVAIITNHSTFDYDWVVKTAKLVMDTRNATAGKRSGGARVVGL